MVLHSEGWTSVYLNEVLVTGLAPMDLRSFETQRLRWAEGNLRTLGFINPVTTPGLTLAQRTIQEEYAELAMVRYAFEELLAQAEERERKELARRNAWFRKIGRWLTGKPATITRRCIEQN